MKYSLRRLRGALFASAAVLTLTAAPVNAAPGDTTTTFTITGGSLSISGPSTAGLGSAIPGGSLSAALGSVTVTDTRAALPAAWTATASTTTFTTGSASSAETIAKSAVSYASGTAGTYTGTITHSVA